MTRIRMNTSFLLFLTMNFVMVVDSILVVGNDHEEGALRVNNNNNFFLRGSSSSSSSPYSLFMSQPCTLLKGKIRMVGAESTPKFTWHCELHPLDAGGKQSIVLPITMQDEEYFPEDATDTYGYPLISGESTVFVPGMEIHKDHDTTRIRMPSVTTTTEQGTTPTGTGVQFGRHFGDRNRGGGHSDGPNKFTTLTSLLPTTNGNDETILPILFVRVQGADVSTTPSSLELEHSILQNLQSQMAELLSSNTTTTTTTTTTTGNIAIPHFDVVEVTIPNAIIGADTMAIRNAVTNTLFSTTQGLETPYQQVIYCLPPGTTSPNNNSQQEETGDWISYEYSNYWNSFYNDEWCAEYLAT